MVALIDELEAAGMAERRPHDEDRRKRAIHLTAHGERTLTEAREIAKQVGGDLLAPLTAAERAEFARLLHKLTGRRRALGLRAMRRLAAFAPFVALLVVAPAALAHDGGQGWYGVVDDKVTTKAGFILIIFFPRLRAADEPAPGATSRSARNAARRPRRTSRATGAAAGRQPRRWTRSATSASAPPRSSRSTARRAATPSTGRPPRGCASATKRSRPTTRRGSSS